ncbi:MAG: ribose 5-phosphate isomerase B [Bacteriovoracaceae bacterium]|nr:ribose 5-phosphate isomerase B [Bacteriovoracaceae bacterium]
MKIYIGCDHAAFEEKEELKSYLLKEGHEVKDCGPFDGERVNYPDYAQKVAKEVAYQDVDQVRGILLCGSGIGVSMVANRFAGVRAALCRNEEEAKLSRGHNNANILCVGARLVSLDIIKKMATTWLSTPFEEGRHAERIALFNDLGERA